MSSMGMVFLHGAGLGSHIWDDIRPLMDLPALYPDFPNRNGSKKANRYLSLDDYTDHIILQIDSWSEGPIVLVAHSIAGIVGIKLIEHYGKRVKGFIALGAAIPKNNESFIRCMPFPQRLIMPLVLSLFGTRPPNKSIRHELGNDLNENQLAAVIEGFSAESKSIFTAKVKYQVLPLPSLYIKLLLDRSFSLVVQEKMIANLKPDKVITLKSGHLPMLSQPQPLALIFNNFYKSLNV